MKLFNYLIIIAILVFFAGCATTPTSKAWRPWTRVMNEGEIEAGSSFNVSVEGETLPLLGDEELLQGNLKENLNSYLIRRGYKITDGQADYQLTLYYKTKRHDRTSSFSALSQSHKSVLYSESYSGAGAGTYSGPGTSLEIAISEAILQIYAGSEAKAKSVSKTETIKSYIHSISVEINNKTRECVWKGEATWDSGNLNLGNELQSAFQILFARLPAKYKIPKVREIKKEKAVNFCELNIRGKWFVNPALPYRVQFVYGAAQANNTMPQGKIKDVRVLSAYVDLIKTAEFALPTGRYYSLGKVDYSYPLENDLWSTVYLGGKYQLIPGEEKVNVLVELNGTLKGYEINKAWIATEEEYKEFEENMQDWKEALKDYFDIYVKK